MKAECRVQLGKKGLANVDHAGLNAWNNATRSASFDIENEERLPRFRHKGCLRQSQCWIPRLKKMLMLRHSGGVVEKTHGVGIKKDTSLFFIMRKGEMLADFL